MYVCACVCVCVCVCGVCVRVCELLYCVNVCVCMCMLEQMRRGLMLVDATRVGKCTPDSFSKTVPIWCCVLNRVMARARSHLIAAIPPPLVQPAAPVVDDFGFDFATDADADTTASTAWSDLPQAVDVQSDQHSDSDSDCSLDEKEEVDPVCASLPRDDPLALHLPSWVPPTEAHFIEQLIPTWVEQVETHVSAAQRDAWARDWTRPLRAVWVGRMHGDALVEPPNLVTLQRQGYTPIVCVNASRFAQSACVVSLFSVWHLILTTFSRVDACPGLLTSRIHPHLGKVGGTFRVRATTATTGDST
jgi:hypothetical protein